MLILNSPEILHQKVAQWKTEDKIHLVPTMGCLHRGHMALIEKAKQEGARTIVSIFVNPLQFGKNEDFDHYPRPFEEDVALLETAGVDCLFAPRTVDLYPEGFSTNVSVKGVSDHLCGKSRPGHFDGVATVCLKLFQITQADLAVFGEKDFQQLRVLEQMIEDLNLSIRIVPHPIVREEDGLALSSRNRYLSEAERLEARRIPEALFAARKAALESSELNAGTLTSRVVETLGSTFAIDYVSIASSWDLVPVAGATQLSEVHHPRIFLAAKLGKTRLIDNVPLFESEP